MKTLDIALKMSLVLFMVGNLLDMGLRLKLQQAIGALRKVRFVTLCLLWGFILLPGLAYLLTVVMPLGLRMPSGSFCLVWRLVRRSFRRWWTRPGGTWVTLRPSCCLHRWSRWPTCL